MKKYSAFFTFLKQNRLLLMLCLAVNLLSGLSKSVGALYLQRITDALEGGQYAFLLQFVLVGGLLTFAAYGLRWIGAIIPRYFSEKFACETRIKLLTHLSKIPFIRYEGYSQGALQSLIQNDSVQAGQAFFIILSRVLNNVFLFLFSVWAMARTNAPATLVAVVIVALAAVINQKILRHMKAHEKAAQQSLSEMTHSLESTFDGLETVKAAGAKDYVVNKYLEKIEALCAHRLAAAKVNALRALWYGFIENLCLYASVGFLGFMAVKGSMTIGEVIMFIYLIKQIIMPIEVVFRWMATLTATGASWERILQHVQDDEEPEQSSPAGGMAAGQPGGPADGLTSEPSSVSAENISFSYAGNRNIIDSLSFVLKKGQLTGLTGASGTGKTTLLKLITGLYQSPTARYTAGGQAVDSLGPASAYAGLDNSLFPMTIYENIALGDASITPDRAAAALDRLGFGPWLSLLPQGVDTFVNEDISGGQRQAIVNARALLSGKALVILDEPFSALDAEKEQRLLAWLEQEKMRRMLLITSHREEAMRFTDTTIAL